ncbi:MAG: hypothetical protein NZT92_06510 [Abditibacteriales bacterium]|nr:hypothetical protein [Abditibacteriales bacterium]MDW8365681.1 hypothetical protein [Abditibacteriales bacterium]
MQRTSLTLMVLAIVFLLGSHVALRAQRSVSAEDLIRDLDRDLSKLVEKFARTFRHQSGGCFGDSEVAALMSMSAFAGEMHGLHAMVENMRQAPVVTMLEMMDATLQRANRAMRRAQVAAPIRAEWERHVARFEALQHAYGCRPPGRVRSRRYDY